MYVRSVRRIKIREISTKQLEENRRELREGAWSVQCEALRLLSRRQVAHAVTFGSCGKGEEAHRARYLS
jgi:hypothetical protein